jgi:hypothetical protein
MAITPLPTAPVRSDPANFTARADAFMTALPTFATEANALQVDVNAQQVSAAAQVTLAANQVTLAAAQATNSAASAAASAASSTSSIWVSGTTYAIGNVRFSPANFQNYRRKTAGAGTTDPSTDTTNWAILATIPTVAGDDGKVLVSDGAALSWESQLDKKWTQITTTTTFTAPKKDVYRFYAFGQGGSANAVTATSASSGGGGGCAYGDITLTKNQTAVIDITLGIVTVTVGGVVMLTAGKGGNAAAAVAGIAGTASKHANVLNGGAFSGGAGATASGSISCGATGGTSGSVLGAGNIGAASGSSTASNFTAIGAAGWGGTGYAYTGTASWLVFGGSIGAAGNGGPWANSLTSSGSTSSPLVGRTKFTAFTDPLIADQNGAGAWHGSATATIAAGGQGSSGIGYVPANGIGAGGGAAYGNTASAGSFGCAGGVNAWSANVNVGAGGYGSGASAAAVASTNATATAGAAICLIYQ